MDIRTTSDQLGKNLRRIRLRKELSQKALAKLCGVSVYRIRMTESGAIRFFEDIYLKALCTALNTDLGALFSTSNEPIVE